MSDSAPRRRSDSYHRQLDLIAEMSHEFATTRDLHGTFQRGLKRVADFIEAEAASLFLVDDSSGELVCQACVGPVDIIGLRLAPGQGVVGRVVEQNVATIVKDARADPHFGALVDAKTGFVTRSILCAPLSVRGQRLGAIELINKTDGGLFHPGDRQLLRALGASAALAVVNARLNKAMVDQERMARELELAAGIQRAMLPPEMPDDFPIHGINHPAHEVSGDFFDVLKLADGRIAFAIGDVSGKGFNASLLMTKTCSLFRCLAKSERRPGRLLSVINAELCETASAGGMFVTMAAGVFDPVSGSVLLANAGHEPPLLLQDGIFTSFAAAVPPLGIAVDMVPPDMTETWIGLAGGCLYLFTDGLTEARCQDALLGAEGVRRLLSEAAGLPPRERLAAVVDRLAPPGSSPRDDLTLLMVEDRRERPCLAVRFEATPECLCDLRHRVAAAVRSAGCGPEAAADIVLAVDEACQNIIRHGYGGKGEVVLEIRKNAAGVLEVQLIDFAPAVDLAKIKSRCLDDIRPGGLGTHFIRAVMDNVAFLPPPVGAGNFLKMTKAIR
ncbi:ATP-binding SpoIIE family protein phosphatase [Telmatospirillum siberiense]|uniref:Serine/threonine protein phosphatase n=1 Tax=Telmatospirillum siberiense TaxID=382514 RepID=A0A2N3PUA1_9PROT|nr:SpoIIE family protein phosphatase [Telmatospirillum siberiense]PKU23979.1 serine/threonine protein phosphatase [Telmatospirillum siberiense]